MSRSQLKLIELTEDNTVIRGALKVRGPANFAGMRAWFDRYFVVCSDDMTLRRYARKEDVNASAVKEAPRIYQLTDIIRLDTESKFKGRFNVLFAPGTGDEGKEGDVLVLDSVTTEARELWISSLTLVLSEKDKPKGSKKDKEDAKPGRAPSRTKSRVSGESRHSEAGSAGSSASTTSPSKSSLSLEIEAGDATTPLDSDAMVGWAPSGEQSVPPPAAHGVRIRGFLRAWTEPSGPPVNRRTHRHDRRYWSIILDDFTLRRHASEADFRSGADPQHVYPIALVEWVAEYEAPDAPFCIVVHFDNKAEIKLLAASADEREAWIQAFSYVMKAVEDASAAAEGEEAQERRVAENRARSSRNLGLSLDSKYVRALAPSLPASTLKEGVLSVETTASKHGRSSFVKRYWVLCSSDWTLRRYAAQAQVNKAMPRVYHISDMYEAVPAQAGTTLTIYLKDGVIEGLGPADGVDDYLVLQAPSASDRADWISSLSAAIEAHGAKREPSLAAINAARRAKEAAAREAAREAAAAKAGSAGPSAKEKHKPASAPKPPAAAPAAPAPIVATVVEAPAPAPAPVLPPAVDDEKDAEEDVALGYTVPSEMSPAYLKDDDVSRKGTLLLFRRGANKWVPKFFALVPNDCTLRRFVDARDAFSGGMRPQAVYPLLAVDTISTFGRPGGSSPMGIEVTFHNGREVRLGVGSEAERAEWIAAIVACMPDDVNDVDPAPVWARKAEPLVLPLLNSATVVCSGMLSLKLQRSLRVSGKPLYLRRHFVLADGEATGAQSVLLRFASAADVGSSDPAKAPRVYPVRDISKLSRSGGAVRLVMYLREGALPGLSRDETYIDLHSATGVERDEWYAAISKLLQREANKRATRAASTARSRTGTITGEAGGASNTVDTPKSSGGGGAPEGGSSRTAAAGRTGGGRSSSSKKRAAAAAAATGSGDLSAMTGVVSGLPSPSTTAGGAPAAHSSLTAGNSAHAAHPLPSPSHQQQPVGISATAYSRRSSLAGGGVPLSARSGGGARHSHGGGNNGGGLLAPPPFDLQVFITAEAEKAAGSAADTEKVSAEGAETAATAAASAVIEAHARYFDDETALAAAVAAGVPNVQDIVQAEATCAASHAANETRLAVYKKAVSAADAALAAAEAAVAARREKHERSAAAAQREVDEAESAVEAATTITAPLREAYLRAMQEAAAATKASTAAAAAAVSASAAGAPDAAALADAAAAAAAHATALGGIALARSEAYRTAHREVEEAEADVFTALRAQAELESRAADEGAAAGATRDIADAFAVQMMETLRATRDDAAVTKEALAAATNARVEAMRRIAAPPPPPLLSPPLVKETNAVIEGGHHVLPLAPKPLLASALLQASPAPGSTQPAAIGARAGPDDLNVSAVTPLTPGAPPAQQSQQQPHTSEEFTGVHDESGGAGALAKELQFSGVAAAEAEAAAAAIVVAEEEKAAAAKAAEVEQAAADKAAAAETAAAAEKAEAEAAIERAEAERLAQLKAEAQARADEAAAAEAAAAVAAQKETERLEAEAAAAAAAAAAVAAAAAAAAEAERKAREEAEATAAAAIAAEAAAAAAAAAHPFGVFMYPSVVECLGFAPRNDALSHSAEMEEVLRQQASVAAAAAAKAEEGRAAASAAAAAAEAEAAIEAAEAQRLAQLKAEVQARADAAAAAAALIAAQEAARAEEEAAIAAAAAAAAAEAQRIIDEEAAAIQAANAAAEAARLEAERVAAEAAAAEAAAVAAELQRREAEKAAQEAAATAQREAAIAAAAAAARETTIAARLREFQLEAAAAQSAASAAAARASFSSPARAARRGDASGAAAAGATPLSRALAAAKRSAGYGFWSLSDPEFIRNAAALATGGGSNAARSSSGGDYTTPSAYPPRAGHSSSSGGSIGGGPARDPNGRLLLRLPGGHYVAGDATLHNGELTLATPAAAAAAAAASGAPPPPAVHTIRNWSMMPLALRERLCRDGSVPVSLPAGVTVDVDLAMIDSMEEVTAALLSRQCEAAAAAGDAPGAVAATDGGARAQAVIEAAAAKHAQWRTNFSSAIDASLASLRANAQEVAANIRRDALLAAAAKVTTQQQQPLQLTAE